MADKKISQLTDGTSLQSGDFVVVARSGDNFKVDPTIFDEITATTVDINGGTIDGTTIGATTPSTGDFTTLTENTTPVVIQTDIGTDPNQVPLNQYLGSMAYQDLENVVVGELTADGLAVDTDTLYVDATNNRVGIGTSSPGTKVEVSNDGASQIAITNTSGTTKNTQLLFKDDAGVKWRVGMDVATNNNTNIFQIYNGATSSASMSIDASNNLLVGTTTTFPGSVSNVAGIHLGGSTAGRGYFSNDGGRALNLNRMTSDGDIVEFRKSGNPVGSIGTRSGQLSIGSSDTGVEFNNANDCLIPFNSSTNAGRDNAIDLGKSDARFKDLYLSGGVYLGGTGAANYLDDYEQGSFTMNIVGYAGGYSANTGNYRKIGDIVYFEFILQASSSLGLGAASVDVEGLPFTSHNEVVQAIFAVESNLMGGTWDYLNGFVQTNHSYFRIRKVTNGGSLANITGSDWASTSVSLQGSGCYVAA